jgi:phosphoribosylformimino-5-aminoimidazole carboxamide ribotide isomerase
VLVIPAIDVAAGRSRIVFWPGAAAGLGTPTDRPEVIAEHFVQLGAPIVHVVDFDGARAGRPVNTDVLGAIASRVATPLQLAGGVEEPDAIRLAFAAGATRVVAGLALADDPTRLRACLEVAGDWLGIGIDTRPDRLAAFPWRRGRTPAVDELIDELAGAGVRRIVASHTAEAQAIDGLVAAAAAAGTELLVAGGARDLAALARLRDAGVAGIILGEALLSGAIDYAAAREAVA